MQLDDAPQCAVVVAKAMGLQGGWCMGLTTVGDDGRPWDCTDAHSSNKAARCVFGKQHLLIIGSPMCRAFSAIQAINKGRMSRAKWDALWNWGTKHLLFSLEIYALQLNAGRYILHEHPANASSWHVPEVVEFMR